MPRDEEIRNLNARRKNIIFLIRAYLMDNGFFQSADALQTEARISDDYELCDNVDLDSIYLEYASYHQLKFGKFPKILRQAKPSVKIDVNSKRKKRPILPTKETKQPGGDSPENNNDFSLTVTKVEARNSDVINEPLFQLKEIDHGALGCGAGGGDELLGSQEWQSLVELVKTTILKDDVKLSWDDMCGNTNAIELVKEAVVTPIMFPKLFVNGLRPWKSILLHGPPGSGKTLLAKILYAETREHVTFFNVTSSIVISKWRGESEKIMRILFNLAQKRAPSIIFLDEIEGLTSKRDRPSDHESSKRFKNEFLQLLDGMEQQSAGVFILASTNLPWDIDDAFLRRFEKKLLVQLPNATQRALLIYKLLPVHLALDKDQMNVLVHMSENFTGDEIRLACKEIAMQTIRKAVKGKDMVEEPIEFAFKQIKPMSVKLMEKHLQWQAEHGGY